MATCNVTPIPKFIASARRKPRVTGKGPTSIGYSDDTAPRIRAYLGSIQALSRIANIADQERYQRGRSLIEGLARSAQGEQPPTLRLSPEQCADVLHFVSKSEPSDPLHWSDESEDAPSHTVGFKFVIEAVEDSMRGDLARLSAHLDEQRDRVFDALAVVSTVRTALPVDELPEDAGLRRTLAAAMRTLDAVADALDPINMGLPDGVDVQQDEEVAS